jgi:DNA-binding NarL/FixJ family response regulator
MSSAGIRVMVVDDHPLMQEGIVAVVEQEALMQVVAKADNGREAVSLYRAHMPDVVVMDLRMPVMDGVEACAEIRKGAPGAKIVMLTTYRGDVHMLRALKAGASGYLLKSVVRTELLTAIREVHAGRQFMPSEVAQELARHTLDEPLSDRELAVLRGVAAGNTNRAVADELFLAEDTIKAHLKKIFSKLSARDRTDAVMIAIRRGIIDGS